MSGVASLPDLVLLAVALPLVGALAVLATGRRPNLREAMSLLAGAATFAAVLAVLGPVMDGARPEVTLWQMIPGLSLRFAVEPLGMLFACVASGLWVVTTVYSIGYMRGHHEANQTRFFACFAIAISSAVGMAFAGNLLTLFVFYEVLTFSTYPLVTHAGTEEAKRGGRTYLGVLLTTSVLFQTPAIIWTWHVAGTLEFRPGGILDGTAPAPVLAGLLALYAFGIGKAALMPFHRWLPAAMVAPTPVSALLHAVAVVKAGVFGIVKVLTYVFGLDLLGALSPAGALAYLAGFTILAASVVAMRQDNLKRRLAYSTVSQLSYVILAAAIFVPASVVGAAMHIAAHAFGKITLFFAAGAIYVAAHKTEVSQLAGIGRRMPWTMGAFAVGALSMVGVPPTVGFVSKWFIIEGAWSAQHWTALSVIVLSTLLNAVYFLPIVYAAFFKPAGDERGHHDHGEAPWTMVAAMMVTAGGTLVLFAWPDVPLGLARMLIGGAP